MGNHNIVIDYSDYLRITFFFSHYCFLLFLITNQIFMFINFLVQCGANCVMENDALQKRGGTLPSVFCQENSGLQILSSELLGESQAEGCPLGVPKHTRKSQICNKYSSTLGHFLTAEYCLLSNMELNMSRTVFRL